VFLNSENLTAANWNKYSGQVITANNAVSPDGFVNADKMSATGGVYEDQPFTASTAFAISVFIKKDTATSFILEFVDQSGPFAGGGITYTFSTGAIAVVQSANSSVSGEAVSYGNGWIRLILKMTANAATNYNYQQFNFIGGTGWAWGFQMEQAAYATSYIPTLGAAITRVADAASKTGISSLIGQTEGTLFLEYPNFDAVKYTGLIGIDDGSSNNRVLIFANGTNGITGQVLRSGTTTNITPYAVSGNVKVAIAYSATEFVFYVNGSARFTGGAVVFSNTMSSLTFNHVNLVGSKTSQTLLFKTRLTNAQLAELTA
jgi:hypothetical protein